jgi:hypothetical protein
MAIIQLAHRKSNPRPSGWGGDMHQVPVLYWEDLQRNRAPQRRYWMEEFWECYNARINRCSCTGHLGSSSDCVIYVALLFKWGLLASLAGNRVGQSEKRGGSLAVCGYLIHNAASFSMRNSHVPVTLVWTGIVIPIVKYRILFFHSLFLSFPLYVFVFFSP